MTNRMIGIYNGETDTYVQREATDAEQAEIDASQAQVAFELAEQEAIEKELKSAKEAILAKIGLTQEEVIILLTPEPAAKIVKE